MKRTVVWMLAMLLITGAAFAQCPMMSAAQGEDGQMQMGGCARGMQQGMQMQQGPMASMMSANESAVFGDNVYMLQGNMLQKRDMEGNIVKSVQLTDMEQIMDDMEAEGTCAVCGMPMDEETRAGCPAVTGAPCPTCGMMHSEGMAMGEGMQDGGMMQGGCPYMAEGATEEGMRGMQRGAMYSRVSIDADADGVYVLRGGQFSVYDHDLNQTKTWRAVSEECRAGDDSVQCAMAEMRKADCPTCRMMLGSMQDERAIPGGMVRMWHRPAALRTGPARIQVQVNNASGMGVVNATVTGYLYPRGSVDQGMGVPLRSVGGGGYFGMVNIPRSGDWDLAVRVRRPGMEDQRVYYNLSVE